jgi:TonB family protein
LNTELDSVALVEEVRRVVFPTNQVILTQVNRDSIGAVVTSPIGMGDLARPTQTFLRLAVARAIRPEATLSEPLFLVLTDQEGVAVRRVAAFRSCPPELQNVAEIQAAVNREGRGLQLAANAVVQVMVLVGPDGRVEERRVYRSSSNAAADAAALRVMDVARYSPMRIEGYPFRISVLLPLMFREDGG